MKTTVMDIGSNSVRIAIEKNGGLLKKEIATTQLAQGLEHTNRLSAEAMLRTVRAILDLSKSVKENGAKKIYAFATEAVRRAENGNEFVECVRDQTGLILDVIDGETEALCGFLGAKSDFDGKVGVLDIGGASVELSVGEDKMDFSQSEPIGAVRLKERFRWMRQQFDGAVISLVTPYEDAPEFKTMVAIGGTPTTVVMMRDKMKAYDPNLIHGQKLTRTEINALYGHVGKMSAQSLIAEFPTLDIKRAEVIPYGMAVLLGVMDATHHNEVIVSEKDNLDGYASLHGIELD